MRYTIKTIMTYKGSENYTPKDKNEPLRLYLFTDSNGRTLKTKLDNELNCEIETPCDVTIDIGDTRKDGNWRKYWIVRNATPILN